MEVNYQINYFAVFLTLFIATLITYGILQSKYFINDYRWLKIIIKILGILTLLSILDKC